MEIGAWLGLAEPRDRPDLARFFSDALFSPPFIRLDAPGDDADGGPDGALPHALAPAAAGWQEHDGAGGHRELCFARFRSGLVQDGFFEEDGVIWAADGTVLAQSRQLGIVMALTS